MRPPAPPSSSVNVPLESPSATGGLVSGRKWGALCPVGERQEPAESESCAHLTENATQLWVQTEV